MNSLPTMQKENTSIWPLWVAIAAAIVIAAFGTAVLPRTVAANALNQPGISVPQCHDNGVSMFWHTSNRGQHAAPEGWKVERRHLDSDRWVVQTFTFIGAQADALQTYNEEYWDWVDTNGCPQRRLHLQGQGHKLRRVRHKWQSLVSTGAVGVRTCHPMTARGLPSIREEFLLSGGRSAGVIYLSLAGFLHLSGACHQSPSS